MEKQQLDAFKIIGIATITSNEEGRAKKDIAALWQQLMTEKVIDQIPQAIDSTIYALYTDYEGDHTQPYTCIIGYKVPSLTNIPSGMVGRTIHKSNYNKFTAKGNLMGAAVIEKWLDIWEMDLNRTYTTDLEIYGEKATDPTNGEADIYIAVK
ncbi:MAG: AraC family transcriptional regulator [Flavobacteriales bacterium]|nr:AraC family transcriptional regulator [Flavobacteriales bacterium]